jgi:hypothetical protein
MAKAGDVFRPGEEVPNSGIYQIIHDPAHAMSHEVTCVYGKKFPPCRGCPHPRFTLVRAAQHIEASDHFKVKR